MERPVHLHDDFPEIRGGGNKLHLLVGEAVDDGAPEAADLTIEEDIVRGIVDVDPADHAIGLPVLDRGLHRETLGHRRAEGAVFYR